MSTKFRPHGKPRHFGESATHPIEQHNRALTVLFLLAGKGLLRRHTLPLLRSVAHSGSSNDGF